jgi:hypothetical protein
MSKSKNSFTTSTLIHYEVRGNSPPQRLSTVRRHEPGKFNLRRVRHIHARTASVDLPPVFQTATMYPPTYLYVHHKEKAINWKFISLKITYPLDRKTQSGFVEDFKAKSEGKLESNLFTEETSTPTTIGNAN